MLKALDPLLHSELRLGVMSILLGVEEADFVFLRQETGATAGNLSVQLNKLQEAGYIEIEKTFRGKIPCTLCLWSLCGGIEKLHRKIKKKTTPIRRSSLFYSCLRRRATGMFNISRYLATVRRAMQ